MWHVPSYWPQQSVFFGAGFLVGLLVLVWRARHRDVPVEVALATFGGTALAGLAGGRIYWMLASHEVQAGAVHADPMAYMNPLTPGYASLGALIGGGAAIALVVSRVPPRAGGKLLDLVVPAGLLALAVARLGCLANGCDFGTTTGGAWGLVYGPDTPAWSFHQSQGWIAATATQSLPTHPFPFYLAIGTVTIVVTGGFIFGEDAADGLRAAFVAFGYLLLRFVTEFWRADSGSGTDLWGLASPQLVAAAMMVACSLYFNRFERRTSLETR